MAQLIHSLKANLHESEERLQLVLEGSQLGFWDWDLRSGIVQRNERLAELLGFQPHELSPSLEQWKALIHPDDRILTESALNNHLLGLKPAYEVECRLLTKSGEYKWFLDRGKVVRRGVKGEPLRMTGTTGDIDRRKQTEMALQASETRFRELADLLPQIVVEADTNGVITYTNKKGFTTFGYTPEEILGVYKILDAIVPEHQERALANFQRTLQGHTSMGGEYNVIRKDGSIFPVLIFSAPIMSGEKVAGIRSLMVDLSEYKRLELALAENEELFNLLLEYSPIFVFFKDEQTRPIRLSKNYEKMLGRPISELLGKTMDELFPSDLAKSMTEDDLRILREGKQIEVVEELNGRFFLTTKFPIQKMNKPYRLAGFTQDITAWKKAEAAAAEANHRLKETIAELERHNQEMAILKWLVEMMQLCQTPEETFGIITSAFRGLFPGVSGLLAVATSDQKDFKATDSWGKKYNQDPIFIDECLALRRKRIFHIDRTLQVFQCKHLLTPGPASSVCIPLIVQEEILGLVNLTHPEDDSFFNAQRLQLIQAISDSAAVALSNQKLRETLRQQAIRDPLTMLFNRRYMEETLVREIKHATRAAYTLGLILLDIDFFKEINDHYGHPLGDKVLHDVGSLFLLQTRGEDVACRYGGDEFLIILPDVTREELWHKACALHDLIKGLKWETADDQIISINTSFGLAIYPADGETSGALIRSADAGLYQAKANGRGRIFFEKHNPTTDVK